MPDDFVFGDSTLDDAVDALTTVEQVRARVNERRALRGLPPLPEVDNG
jgi:hypothetical protein